MLRRIVVFDERVKLHYFVTIDNTEIIHIMYVDRHQERLPLSA